MEFKVGDELDHQRWLMNNGLFTQSSKNNLYAYGSLVHTEVQAVDLAIDIDSRTFTYTIYVPAFILKAKQDIDFLKSKKTLWSLFKLRRLIKKYGHLDFYPVLMNFILDYCGPNWKVNLIVDNIKNYKEPQELEVSRESGGVTKDPKFDR